MELVPADPEPVIRWIPVPTLRRMIRTSGIWAALWSVIVPWLLRMHIVHCRSEASWLPRSNFLGNPQQESPIEQLILIRKETEFWNALNEDA